MMVPYQLKMRPKKKTQNMNYYSTGPTTTWYIMEDLSFQNRNIKVIELQAEFRKKILLAFLIKLPGIFLQTSIWSQD